MVACYTQKLLCSHSINPIETTLSSSCIRPCMITLLLQYHSQEERKVKSSVVYNRVLITHVITVATQMKSKLEVFFRF